jgi:hypothetical protein
MIGAVVAFLMEVQKEFINFGSGFKNGIKQIIHRFCSFVSFHESTGKESRENKKDQKRPGQKIGAAQIDRFGKRADFGNRFLHDPIKAHFILAFKAEWSFWTF